ncbi:MAG TPA: hypothetical protein VGM24_11785, partial [Puia sp.]
MIINRNNYEEYFLLYIDRELNRDERMMVDDFVVRHPDLEKEFNALKQTIAAAPRMVYEGKEKLLKENKRRIYPVYWMRLAATLIILLAGGWFLLLVTGKTRRPDGPVSPSKEVARRAPVRPQGNPSNMANPVPPAKKAVQSGNKENPVAAANPKTQPVSQQVLSSKEAGADPVKNSSDEKGSA